MTCRELADFIMAYLDGELPADQRTEFDRHLAVCPPCVRYLASYRTTVGAAKALARGDADARADVPDDLVKAILAARSKHERPGQ